MGELRARSGGARGGAVRGCDLACSSISSSISQAVLIALSCSEQKTRSIRLTPASQSSEPASRASSRPRIESGGSAQPVNRFCAFHSE